MNPLWFATRATGEVAFLLLTMVSGLGVLSAARVGGRRVPRFVLTGLHRNLSLVTLVFLGLHLLTAVTDPFAGLTASDTLVPFHSAYRPLWVGLGAIAFDLLAALLVTSLLRERLGSRTWKALHWSAYGCWSAALVHGLGSGSDVKTTLGIGLAGACAAATVLAIAWRLITAPPEHTRTRLVLAATGVVAITGVVAWTVAGPLAPGWAGRAGTPAKLLGGSAGPVDGAR